MRSITALGVTIACATAAAQVVTDIADPQHPRWQGSVHCGPASMAIVLDLIGHSISNHDLGAIADDRGYCSLEQLRIYANRRGVKATALQIEYDELCELNKPAILHVRMSHGNGVRDHFIVYAGRTSDGQGALLLDADAAGPRGVMPATWLIPKWSGAALLFGVEAESKLLTANLALSTILASSGAGMFAWGAAGRRPAARSPKLR